jgi:hypothetical protein
MAKCQVCGKSILLSSQGVIVVEGRPDHTVESLRFMEEEKLALFTLQKMNAQTVNFKTDVVVCKECWSTKLEPPQIEMVDQKLAAITAGGSQRPKVSLTPLGKLTGQYYASGLAQILETSRDRDVLGWALFALRLAWMHTKELNTILIDTVLPKVKSLTSYPDEDVAQAARFVVQRFDGTLDDNAWNVFAPVWNDFRKKTE